MARGDQVARRRLRILMILGRHGGGFTAADLQILLGATSAATMYRDLTALVHNGLLSRIAAENDPSHEWQYFITDAGGHRLARVIGSNGSSVPANVRFGAGSSANILLKQLSIASQSGDAGQVVEWRSGLDAAWWLRQHGVDDVQVDALGIWAEADLAIRFLVLVDHPSDHLAEKLIERLGRQASPLPVNAILLISPTRGDEKFLLDLIRDTGLTTVTATTTMRRLWGPDGPIGPIWSTPDSTDYLRLIELTSVGPDEGK
ncbi:hypothetical protein [Catelliglobosispora koreensis]|uniref:hypothetical protein n=1 Tax=Catelliglobosispora koreensis TaxID=129052 RepID=UPI00037EAA6A|nr:hypothetical protein [Catelliglobosispora koreensis]